MSPFSNSRNSQDLFYSTRTLFGFLLECFGMEKELSRIGRRLASHGHGDWLKDLPAFGEELGLRMERLSLEPSDAAEVSSPQAPLIGRLADGSGWLVLRGFRAGKVRMAINRGDLIEEDTISLSKVAEKLGLAQAQSSDWLLTYPKAPMAGAVSEGHDHHLPPFRRLLAVARAERPDLLLVLGLAVGSGMLALAPPVAVQALVNTVAMGGMGQPLAVLSIILFLFLAFSGAVYVLESYLVELVQRRIFVRLAVDLAQRLPKVRCEVYDRHHGAELVNRFFDVLTVQKAGSSLMLDGITLLMQAGVGLLLLAFYHPFLLAFDIVLLLSIGFIMFVLGRGGVATAIEESKSKYALVAWLEIVARNLWTFKSDGGPQWAADSINELAHVYLTAKRAHFRVLLRQTIGSLSLYALASTALLAIGGFLVINGRLTLGQLVASELIVSTVLASLIKFGKQLEIFFDLMAGVDKIGHLLDLPLEREGGESREVPGPAALAVKGLSFGYAAKKPIFAGLEFEMGAGEKAAIIGGQGSGKSTLAQLMCGMRGPTAGRIEIDGIDLGEMRLDALRSRIAVVSRLEIIEGSILENVRIGRSGIGPEEAKQALASVGLPDLLDIPPDRLLDVDLGPNGAPLSATEAVLLSMARAIAGRPALLVLDDVLDDLDENTRQKIFPVLLAPDAPWTLLVMTRKPAVAARCGRLIELRAPGAEGDVSDSPTGGAHA